MPKKNQLIIVTTRYPAQSEAQRLFAHTFTAAELQILSRNVNFKERVRRMSTVNDAFELADFGAKLIKDMVKRGEWSNNRRNYPDTRENSTVSSQIHSRP